VSVDEDVHARHGLCEESGPVTAQMGEHDDEIDLVSHLLHNP